MVRRCFQKLKCFQKLHFDQSVKQHLWKRDDIKIFNVFNQNILPQFEADCDLKLAYFKCFGFTDSMISAPSFQNYDFMGQWKVGYLGILILFA